uniref:Ig-like domain-containing protein n=1 Tax=Angiostrongylus cantonensis TaxID=6313 RepID=A0A0K0DR23_ANGCA
VVPRLLILPVTNPVQKPSGQQVPLLCSVQGVPNETRPGIVWSKHDGIDKTGNAEVKSLDHHTMSLLIKNATSDDSGVYTCQAQIGNRLLSRTVDVIIFVEKKEKFKLLNDDAVLQITNYAPIKDAGEYVCKVFHPTSGSTLYRKITIGSESENKQLFCSKMCNNVCNYIYPSVVN